MRRGQVIAIAAGAIAVVVAISAAIYFMQPSPGTDIAVTEVVPASSASTTPAATGPATTTSAASEPGADGADTVVAAAAASSNSVPGTIKERMGDWQLSCDTPPGASFEQCAIIQNVTAEDQPNVGLSVIVLKTADNQARLLRVLAPLGVLLPNGLGLNVDGTDMGRVAFVRCLPNGCVAEVVMDDALLATLSKGSSAIFIVFKTPEEGIGIPVSLNGFAEGFDALP